MLFSLDDNRDDWIDENTDIMYHSWFTYILLILFNNIGNFSELLSKVPISLELWTFKPCLIIVELRTFATGAILEVAASDTLDFLPDIEPYNQKLKSQAS